jgi:predicted dienelactone hydrolase
MSRSTYRTDETQQSGMIGGVRELWSNFLLRLGFTHSISRSHPAHHSEMSSTPHKHRTFPSMPRDYIRRRRLTRRLSNLIFIPLLSIVAAYVITRQPSGGFSAPKTMQTRASVAAQPALEGTPSAAPAPESASHAVANLVRPDGYELADGPHAVTEVPDVVLHDVKRSRDLHLRIFYPTEAGPFPVIVFSHGAGGSQSCCDSLTRHWATYGYVTLQPTHEDSVSLRRNGDEDDAKSLAAVRDALKNPEVWKSRPEDISFVLDSFAALQNHVPALAGKLDASHIGVGGHSMGAFAADAIAGAMVDLPDRPGTSFADPRVGAILLLSPQGPGEFGLNDHPWDRVALPLLSMTGSLDRAANGEGPEWKKIPFDRSQAGDKYHVFIEGANHMSFISARPLAPARAPQAEIILGYANSAALAFWDAYLKADTGAKSYLNSDALPQFSAGAVKLYRR